MGDNSLQVYRRPSWPRRAISMALCWVSWMVTVISIQSSELICELDS